MPNPKQLLDALYGVPIQDGGKPPKRGVSSLPGYGEGIDDPTTQALLAIRRNLGEAGRAAVGVKPYDETNPTETYRAMQALFNAPTPAAIIPEAAQAAGKAAGVLSGLGALGVVKPKGGNWLTGAERGVKDFAALKPVGPSHRDEALILGGPWARDVDTPQVQSLMKHNAAISDWIDNKLGKYVRNEMATPEDPVRALAERGITLQGVRPAQQSNILAYERELAGYPKEGMARTPEGKAYEEAADRLIKREEAGSLLDETQYGPAVEDLKRLHPWLEKIDPQTPVYSLSSLYSDRFENTGFRHLVDELFNATNPESGLPRSLQIAPDKLQKVTVPQAVELVDKINKWRAEQKVAADLKRSQNAATVEYKAYDTIPGTTEPNQRGLRWVELRTPEITSADQLTPEAKAKYQWYLTTGAGEEAALRQAAKYDESLAESLKYEGEVMGHCVGGYCPDVESGRSRIYSLRDKKGEPHVTIEVQPNRSLSNETSWFTAQPEEVQDAITQEALIAHEAAKSSRTPGEDRHTWGLALSDAIRKRMGEPSPEIVQIKGKANRAPKDEYLPFVQDFVRSGQWSSVGDLGNTGLIRKSDYIDTFTPEMLDSVGVGEYMTKEEFNQLADKLGGINKMAAGGAVSMQDGGSPLDQFYQPANPMARRAAEQERMRQEIARRRAEELARQQTPLDTSLPGPSPTRPGLPSMADLKGAFERRVMPVISEAKQTAMTGGILGDLARAYGEASVPVNQAMATALGRPFEQERPPAAPPEMTVPTAFERRGDIFQQLAGQAIGDPANLLDPGILRGLEAGARAVKPSVMRGLEAGTQAARPYAQTLAEMVEEMAMKGVPGTDAMQLRMGILPETPKLPEAPTSTAEAQSFTGRIKDDAQLIAVRGQAPASVERAETALNSGQRVFKLDENGNQVQVMDPAELVDVQPESLRIVNISPQELEAVNLAAKRNPEAQRSMLDQIEGLHRDFAPEDGWAPLNIVEAEVKVDKRGKPIINRQTGLPMTEVKPAKTPYAFHIPPEGMPKEAWEEVLAARLTDEVDQVLQRAKAGDQDAISILQEAAWYRAMRNRLRSEFGGIGDVFADVLGTTSAQTGVEQNFDNAVEILRRFARGDYDRELLAYDKRVRAGETVDGKVLTRMFRDNEFPLITKAGGQLFNANSPASMGALLDMFRAIKAGDAPKTPNFTGNLIGLTNEATIDVWAARMLRRLADLPRIAPPAEKGVAGLHKVGSTLYQPDVSGEFGFGQDVFRKAAQELNNAGMLKAYDPVIGDLGPDDLQAIAWFIEKELWTKNKWTSKAGEGGSLDYEMSFAGTPDSERVKSLRKDINKQFSPAKYPQRKVEGDEDYAKRLETERIAFETNKADKAEQLKNLKADVNRYRLGVSGERPNKPMSDYGQAELASEFDDVVRDDPSVVTYNLTSTLGSFMGDTERALNAEFITRSDFNPLPLERRLVEQGKYYDQDAVFMSKAVPIDAPNARPGVEIYFKQKLSPADMALVTEKLRSYGVDGFTYISDMRMENRPNLRVTTQAMQNKTFRPFAEDLRPEPGSSGITFQYIPEFDDEFDAANAAAIMQQRREIYMQIIEDMANSGNVSDARLTHFDTKVFFRGDYDDYLARATGDSYQAPRREQQSGSISEEPNTRGKNQQKLQRAVSDRVREEASSQAVKKPGGKKPLAKAAGGRVHVSNNLDTMLLELMRNKRYG